MPIMSWIDEAEPAAAPALALDSSAFAPSFEYRDSKLYWQIDAMWLIANRFVVAGVAVADATRLMEILDDVDLSAWDGQHDAAIELHREEALAIVQRIAAAAIAEKPLTGKALRQAILRIFPTDSPAPERQAMDVAAFA